MVIQQSHVDVETPTGPMRTYMYRPVAAGRYGTVIFYSEIFQQTAPIARAAAMLAGNGLVVAVPEIYHEDLPAGTVLAYDPAGTERGNALKIAKPVQGWDDDCSALLSWLSGQPFCNGKRGAAGFCIGGHLAFRAAMHTDVLATACFYPTDIHSRTLGEGQHDNSLQRVSDIRGELMMVFGRQDPHIPADGRTAIHAALTAANLNFTWHEFNAQHAFMRDEGPRYDPELALLGYRLAIEMFHRTLH